jgi:hypothetical protein
MVFIADFPDPVNRQDADDNKRGGVMKRFAMVAVAAAMTHCAMSGNVAAQAEGLVGTWEWMSVDNTAPDGTRTQPFGPKPGGYLSLDGNGRFFWLITRPGRAKFASGRRDQGTEDENRATVQGSLAYGGTYSVDGDTLNMKIEVSTYPNEEGVYQKRTFTLLGDQLSWHNPSVSTGASGVARLRRVH